jgi:glycine C-acetyltransferase
MNSAFLRRLDQAGEQLRHEGLFKHERIISSPQDPTITLANGRRVTNFCANNYLGLADHPEIIAAAHAALDRYGYGMASVRFICGTQTIHKELESKLSTFLGTEDTILYSSCFDANGGLFETLLDEQDVIISVALNHASIIDGVRLSKAQRLRYANNDINDLEAQLKASAGARVRLIATDGVFSMDGVIARLKDICDLAERYDAVVMVDDSHATGFVGPTGRGTHEFRGVMDRIDILTGTFGKALGGGSGGYTSGRKEIITWLRQRSRPYLFSNSIPPAIAAVTLRVLELISASSALRDTLWSNTAYFRKHMTDAGFNIVPGEHPITPIMLGDAKLASMFAEQLLAEGIYVIGFSFPVVPMGKARIRVQVSAAHTREQLDHAITSFTKIGRELGVIK